MGVDERSTLRQDHRGRIDVRRFRLVVVEPPQSPSEASKRGAVWDSQIDTCLIGSKVGNDLVLDDLTVSRFHCEVKIDSRGAMIRDISSTNGTIVDGVRVESAHLRDGSQVRLGRVVLRFELLNQSNRLPLYDGTQFGAMVSSSIAMRACFAVMERAAGCDASVLFEGETGTGKTTAADAIHRASARREGLFLVVDCSALARNLIEDDLFGHEEGAFTGAGKGRKGVFEEANGGTVFLDEIGELPLDLQPKLLRVLENREVRRLGSSKPIRVNVRVIAATHKDLRAEMNAGNFRADLYYRLAVLRARIPALRERPEDIPLICDRLLDDLGASQALKDKLCTQDFLSDVSRSAWPGNIRELRNHLERCKILGDGVPLEEPLIEGTRIAVDATRPFKDEKERAQIAFERDYLRELLRIHGGNVTKAAASAKLSRPYLHRLLKEHGIRSE